MTVIYQKHTVTGSLVSSQTNQKNIVDTAKTVLQAGSNTYIVGSIASMKVISPSDSVSRQEWQAGLTALSRGSKITYDSLQTLVDSLLKTSAQGAQYAIPLVFKFIPGPTYSLNLGSDGGGAFTITVTGPLVPPP
jgi:predicted small secreted protein